MASDDGPTNEMKLEVIRLDLGHGQGCSNSFARLGCAS